MDYVIIAAVITGTTEVFKRLFGDKYVEVAALTIGVIAGILFVDSSIGTQVFTGLAFGLASMGVFDIAKIGKDKSLPK